MRNLAILTSYPAVLAYLSQFSPGSTYKVRENHEIRAQGLAEEEVPLLSFGHLSLEQSDGTACLPKATLATVPQV